MHFPSYTRICEPKNLGSRAFATHTTSRPSNLTGATEAVGSGKDFRFAKSEGVFDFFPVLWTTDEGRFAYVKCTRCGRDAGLKMD